MKENENSGSCNFSETINFGSVLTELQEKLSKIEAENVLLRNELENVKACNVMFSEELSKTRMRVTTLAFSAGVLSDDDVSFFSSPEWGEMMKKEGFVPQGFLMTRNASDDDAIIYSKVTSDGFLTTSDVMKLLGVTRPSAQKSMERAAQLHDDLFFFKQRIKTGSKKSVWVLEHASFRSCQVVSGIV